MSLATRKILVSRDIGVLFCLLSILIIADANPRYFVDVRTANVSRGKRANGDRYIEIQD